MCDDKWQLYLALALGLQKGKAGLISNNRMHSTQTHDNHCSTSHYSNIPTMNKKEVGKGEKGKRAFESILTHPSLCLVLLSLFGLSICKGDWET